MSIEFKVFDSIKIPVDGDPKTNITYIDEGAIKIHQDDYTDKGSRVCFAISEIDSLIESLLFAKKIFTSHE